MYYFYKKKFLKRISFGQLRKLLECSTSLLQRLLNIFTIHIVYSQIENNKTSNIFTTRTMLFIFYFERILFKKPLLIYLPLTYFTIPNLMHSFFPVDNLVMKTCSIFSLRFDRRPFSFRR